MYLPNMIHHLILSRKSAIACTLATNTPSNGTPEHCLFGRVRSVVMPVEVGPATEGFCATSGKGTSEDEDAGVVRGLYSAYV
jgi:hypothetical protein